MSIFPTLKRTPRPADCSRIHASRRNTRASLPSRRSDSWLTPVRLWRPASGPGPPTLSTSTRKVKVGVGRAVSTRSSAPKPNTSSRARGGSITHWTPPRAAMLNVKSDGSGGVGNGCRRSRPTSGPASREGGSSTGATATVWAPTTDTLSSSQATASQRPGRTAHRTMAAPQEGKGMAELEPVHLLRWIDANRHAFAPPVANKEVFPESEFIYQIIRGPNARNDFHIDPGDEIFYQLAGDITVRCREAGGGFRDVCVREGEAMLVRAGTPHCPIRPAGTWGLVVERKRRPDELDALAWFCERCGG